jgi:adenylosuccinate synthase
MRELGTTVIFGGQAGSEGKGAIVGYLARRQYWGGAICSFMTNAGHTWVNDLGAKAVVQQLPMAVVSPEIPYIMIGPGSAITLDQLDREINEFDKAGFYVSNRLFIHPNAMIIEPEDVKYELDHALYLGSTAKGCGRALARKAMRSKSVLLAKHIPWLDEFLSDTTVIANRIIEEGSPLLIEGSQGFDLDLNHGIEYPYCTSRGTTPMQTLADCGIDGRRVDTVIATLRTYPIRVGNVVENGLQIGYSGPFGGKELTWEEITRRSGSPEPLEERTTVTKRVRRVFELDMKRLQFMRTVCNPSMIALTFADYLDWGIRNISDVPDLEPYPKVEKFIVDLENELGVPVALVKTGERDSAMIDLDRLRQGF